jgi:hypothetical protein
MPIKIPGEALSSVAFASANIKACRHDRVPLTIERCGHQRANLMAHKGISDPIDQGFGASLALPGGNITGSPISS